MLLHGAALACLLGSSQGCATKPVVRTETVEVKVPVLVRVPAELTRVDAEPRLPAGEITNDALADFVEQLRAWGRGLAGKLRKVEALQPKGAE